MYNITFQQIETFLTVARYLNLSKAAEAMFISQPALSKTLQRFEEGIGLKMFTRSNQGVVMTNEGEYLFSTLEPLYNNMDKTIKTAQNLSAAPTKVLRVVEPSSYDASEDYDTLKNIIRQYESRYPDVVVIESLCDFRELRQQLAFGDVDIVISQDFAVRNLQDVSYRCVSPYSMYVAMSSSHPLAAYDTLMVDRLQNERFFIVPQTGAPSDTENAVEQCKRLGFAPKSVEFSPNFQTLLHTIRQRNGMSICGRYKYIGADDIKYYPLAPSTDPSYVAVAWRKGKLTREARNFISLLPEDIGGRQEDATEDK
jgi:DNA-binding transcriptional LysR family regulator